ncbi:putative uncharacterized protein DDB_G0283431 [Condylostylus longicornis]|uniref:putative uncharacterized protein DDB_G0283431 n=1 Tax=Condylostylus longicornis TaxID=2530218 RepID=UPI00244DA926|nr:putative uncharacterized protein DDB_G0283431 [Condylostylus longicornis]
MNKNFDDEEVITFFEQSLENSITDFSSDSDDNYEPGKRSASKMVKAEAEKLTECFMDERFDNGVDTSRKVVKIYRNNNTNTYTRNNSNTTGNNNNNITGYNNNFMRNDRSSNNRNFNRSNNYTNNINRNSNYSGNNYSRGNSYSESRHHRGLNSRNYSPANFQNSRSEPMDIDPSTSNHRITP